LSHHNVQTSTITLASTLFFARVAPSGSNQKHSFQRTNRFIITRMPVGASAAAVSDLASIALRHHVDAIERHGAAAPLDRDAHAEYLLSGLGELPESFIALDASRAWIAYWCVHGLAILGRDVAASDPELARRVVGFLRTCASGTPRGGFGGGPGQMAHLATTYAATAALVTIGSDDARELLGEMDVRGFLMSLKETSSGAFRVHEGGETDTRGCYAALATAHLCGVLDDDLKRGVAEYVSSCQTYEGGIGGEPGGEAHGGYTYCGLAACAIAGDFGSLDLGSLERWLANRQGEAEGGFNGRTNKLVDGCYSFWQGGCFPLLERANEALLSQFIERSRKSVARADVGADFLAQSTRITGACAATIFSSEGVSSPAAPFAGGALQGWILDCCQSENGVGGLRDKPGTGRDHYHTCYCLSGLSLAQYHGRCGVIEVVGPAETNALLEIEPLVNVVKHKYDAWMRGLA